MVSSRCGWRGGRMRDTASGNLMSVVGYKARLW